MIRSAAVMALVVFSSIVVGGCQRSEDFPNGSRNIPTRKNESNRKRELAR